MFARYASAVTSGTFVTLALLYVMQGLINIPSTATTASTPTPPIWNVGLIEERPVETLNLQKQFEDIKEPVDTTPPRPGPDSGVDAVGVKLTSAPSPRSTEFGGLGNIMQDGPLVAIVRVSPVYPVRAAEQGLEGYVDVQFDITRDGTVTNLSVVTSSHRIFEKAAINAAKKFRFKARVVDGIPQPSFGIQNRFRFRMERG
ncbi:MAG: TonB family protein [Gammaproteobacteria bacterium]|nr:TonB family protein [Gammaproteobacteria bacterium]